MTEKDLKKLSRSDLLELLVQEVRENESLKQELSLTKAKLAEQEITIQSAGSIAEAALKLSGIFEDAQAAADIYLRNLARLERQQALREAACSQDGEAHED